MHPALLAPKMPQTRLQTIISDGQHLFNIYHRFNLLRSTWGLIWYMSSKIYCYKLKQVCWLFYCRWMVVIKTFRSCNTVCKCTSYPFTLAVRRITTDWLHCLSLQIAVPDELKLVKKFQHLSQQSSRILVALTVFQNTPSIFAHTPSYVAVLFSKIIIKIVHFSSEYLPRNQRSNLRRSCFTWWWLCIKETSLNQIYTEHAPPRIKDTSQGHESEHGGLTVIFAKIYIPPNQKPKYLEQTFRIECHRDVCK